MAFENIDALQGVAKSIIEACTGGLSSAVPPKWVKDPLPDTEDKCPLCLDLFEEESLRPMRTECGHVICASCLGRWSQQASTCPCCRGDMGRSVALRKTSGDAPLFPLVASVAKLDRMIEEAKVELDAGRDLLVVTSFVTILARMQHLFGDRPNFRCIVAPEHPRKSFRKADCVLFSDMMCYYHYSAQDEKRYASFNSDRLVTEKVFVMEGTIDEAATTAEPWQALKNRLSANRVAAMDLDDVD